MLVLLKQKFGCRFPSTTDRKMEQSIEYGNNSTLAKSYES